MSGCFQWSCTMSGPKLFQSLGCSDLVACSVWVTSSRLTGTELVFRHKSLWFVLRVEQTFTLLKKMFRSHQQAELHAADAGLYRLQMRSPWQGPQNFQDTWMQSCLSCCQRTFRFAKLDGKILTSITDGGRPQSTLPNVVPEFLERFRRCYYTSWVQANAAAGHYDFSRCERYLTYGPCKLVLQVDVSNDTGTCRRTCRSRTPSSVGSCTKLRMAGALCAADV